MESMGRGEIEGITRLASPPVRAALDLSQPTVTQPYIIYIFFTLLLFILLANDSLFFSQVQWLGSRDSNKSSG